MSCLRKVVSFETDLPHSAPSSIHHHYPTMASLARIASRIPVNRVRLSPSFAARRSFATPTGANGQQPAKNLAAEALAGKTGHAPTQPTVPKGKNKPSKIEKTPTSNAVKTLYALLGITTVGLVYNVGTLFSFAVSLLVFFLCVSKKIDCVESPTYSCHLHWQIGCPYPDEEGVRDAEKHPDENIVSAYARRAQERFHATRERIAEPIWDKLLPDPLPAPYQQPYTLVINLDNTLIHSTWDKDHGWRVAKRPGAEYFLAYLFQHYEIVIFTTQNPDVRLERPLERKDIMKDLCREGTYLHCAFCFLSCLVIDCPPHPGKAGSLPIRPSPSLQGEHSLH